MAFVRVWSGINFSGTGRVLSVGPIDLGTSPLTVNSVEVAPYYCITVFDGANYTGNFKTYFSNNVDTSSFSLIKSIIVQDCLVPYHNDYNKSVVSANDYQTYVALNRYINLQEDATEYYTAFYYLLKNQTDYKIGDSGFQSIVIPPGYYATFFDGNQRSITFYNSVYFLDAFKDLESNPFSSASYLQYMKIFMKNPPCSVTDPCPTCPTCPTCPRPSHPWDRHLLHHRSHPHLRHCHPLVRHPLPAECPPVRPHWPAAVLFVVAVAVVYHPGHQTSCYPRPSNHGGNILMNNLILS